MKADLRRAGNFAQRFGLRIPIMLAPMAGACPPSLSIAVSNAGGLGIISAMNLNADYLRGQIRKCRELTDKPFGVNVMLMSPHVKEVAQGYECGASLDGYNDIKESDIIECFVMEEIEH